MRPGAIQSRSTVPLGRSVALGKVRVPTFSFPRSPMSALPSEYLPSPEEFKQGVEGRAETDVPLEAKFLFDLQSRTEGDASELLKNAYLCRGAGLLLVAPTGVGKSVLLMQLLISWG